MLKNIIYGIAAAALLTACTDDYTDWANPQANGPEGTKTATLAVSPVAPILLADVQADSVQAFTPTLTMEEAATATFEVTLSAAGQEQTFQVGSDAQGRLAKAELTNAITTCYGKRPTARTLTAEVNAYVKDNGQAVRKQGTVEITATPEAPVIEEAYYLIGTHNNWQPATVTDWKFSHSGLDVYDDPVFTLTVPAPTDDAGNRVDFWFNIVPESSLSKTGDAFYHDLIGSDVANGDDRSEAGLAVKTDGQDNAFCQYAADGAKFYKITLNMLDGRMTVEALSFEEYIYMPGNPQGWDPATAPALRSASFDGVYTGFAYLDGDFKFTKGTSWNDGEYAYGDFSSYGEGFAAGDGSNIKFAGTPGYYAVRADVPSGSLTATAVQWGVIGTAQPGGWDTDTDMTYNPADDCWEATLALTAGEMKFRANDGWDYDFGGSLDDLTQGGANISIAEAGTYAVKLYISRSHGHKNCYATLTKTSASAPARHARR